MTDTTAYISERETAARLAFAAAAGTATLLFIDVQRDYFSYDRLRVRSQSEETRQSLVRIGKRISHFANAASKLQGIWAVHAHSKQMKLIASRNNSDLRDEIVTKVPARHDVIVKEGFCAFEGTKLAAKLGSPKTLVMIGGIFEVCVTATAISALTKHGHNVVLVSDLVAARGGLSGGHIRAHTPGMAPDESVNGAWIGTACAHTVLDIMRPRGVA